MKILFVTNHSYMFYRFRRELLEEMQKEHEVILSTPFVGHEQDFMDMGITCIETKVDRRGKNPFKDYRLFKTYRALLKKEKPDLVVTYSIKPNVYAGYCCGRLGIPFCANVQGLGTAFQKKGLDRFVTILYKESLKKAEYVFFENAANAEEFQKRKIIPLEKQVLLSGAGVNLDRYRYQPLQEKECIHFLYLGRIMKEKGMDELFYAVEKLHQEGYRFVLDLAGFYEDEYEESTRRLQEKGIAVYHGFQETPELFYASADCVIMPSYHEGMSNVNLEAAAMGRPVITTDVPGCREAVEDGKTGFLCATRDKESLYSAMKKFFTLSVEERTKMGMAARAKMEKEFDRTQVVEKTAAVLKVAYCNGRKIG